MKIIKIKKNQLTLVWLSVLLVLVLLSACSDEIAPVLPASTASSGPAATATVSTSPTSPTVPTTQAVTTVAATSQAATTSAATSLPATTAAPAPSVAQPSTPTPVAVSSDPAKLQNIIYLKENKLRAYNVESGRSFDLAKDLSVFRYTVSPDHKKVAFLINNQQIIDLGLITLNGATASEVVRLDSGLGKLVPSTEDNPFAGMYLRAFSLDFSPSSATLAYTKTNPSGPVFESWRTPVRPTEIWLSDLNQKTRRLVANDEKNFMYKLAYSPDGERIGFIRTARFPSDVSGTSAVWSVHQDGSKLSLLADGAKLTKQLNPAATPDEPGLITNFEWDSPLSVSFGVAGSTGGSTWVHDLSNAKDRLLLGSDSSASSFTLYDPLSHRYAFSKDQGIYTIGTLNGQTKPVPVTTKTNKLLSFYDNTVMFLTDANTVALQSINDDGSLVSVVLGLRALHKAEATVRVALPGNGSWLVGWAHNNSEKLALAVYSGDGSLLTPQPLQSLGGEFIRLSNDLFLIDNYGKSLQLLDLSAKPTLKTIDTEEVYYYHN